jgi:hypothetical protein
VHHCFVACPHPSNDIYIYIYIYNISASSSYFLQYVFSSKVTYVVLEFMESDLILSEILLATSF